MKASATITTAFQVSLHIKHLAISQMDQPN